MSDYDILLERWKEEQQKRLAAEAGLAKVTEERNHVMRDLESALRNHKAEVGRLRDNLAGCQEELIGQAQRADAEHVLADQLAEALRPWLGAKNIYAPETIVGMGHVAFARWKEARRDA